MMRDNLNIPAQQKSMIENEILKKKSLVMSKNEHLKQRRCARRRLNVPNILLLKNKNHVKSIKNAKKCIFLAVFCVFRPQNPIFFGK